MAPVTSPGVDNVVNHTGQLVSTILTFAIAAVVLLWVARMCHRERILWPAVVLVAGTATCLLEPMFDHLYGLWFPSEGQWHLFTAYGIHEPVWLAPAYLAIYGGGAVFIARQLQRTPTRRVVWRFYWALVAVAMVAEIGYVQILEVYNYQGNQPFEVLGYPLFLGFVNSMSALVAGILIYRLLPLLQGTAKLSLLLVSPIAFAVEAFGSGFIYLAIRHSGESPSDVLLYLGALTVPLGTYCSVRLLTLLLPDDDPPLAGATSTGDPRSVALPAAAGGAREPVGAR